MQCESNDDISKEHQRAVVDIVQAIESIPVFSTVKETLGETGSAVVKTSDGSVTNGWPSCCTQRAHYLAMLMLFWPYPEVAESRGTRLQKIVDQQLESSAMVGSQLLRNEVHQLRQQFQSVLGYVDRCGKCRCHNNAA